MKRIIFLTFGILGWAWYEMSGGAGFEPGAHSSPTLARFEQPVERKPQADERSEVVARADVSAGQLTSFQPKSRIQIVDEPTMAPDSSTESLADVAKVAAALDETEARIVLSGLGDDPANLGQVVGISEQGARTIPPIDYREVTGSRVNLRGGPSTAFGVVTVLQRGEEVEVLEDSGDGWVKLRALSSENIGWMSDNFLVASR